MNQITDKELEIFELFLFKNIFLSINVKWGQSEARVSRN